MLNDQNLSFGAAEENEDDPEPLAPPPPPDRPGRLPDRLDRPVPPQPPPAYQNPNREVREIGPLRRKRKDEPGDQSEDL